MPSPVLGGLPGTPFPRLGLRACACAPPEGAAWPMVILGARSSSGRPSTGILRWSLDLPLIYNAQFIYPGLEIA